MRLSWQRKDNGWVADMGSGRLAMIAYSGHNKYRPWKLTMQKVAGVSGPLFEARLHTLRDARMVASAVHDA